MHDNRDSLHPDTFTPDEMLAENFRRLEQKQTNNAGAQLSRLVRQSLEADPEYRPDLPQHAAEMLRLRHDFAFWAERCVKIQHKLTGRLVPFVLNAPQRVLVLAMERQRLAGKPIRIILLKARQWGGSTVTQMYMAWIQCVHRVNWHSLICAHVKDTAATIRGMYSTMLDLYPTDLWIDADERADADDDTKPRKAPPQRFKPYEGSRNNREIVGRGCVVSIGSCENQEAARGNNYAMVHLSEVAFWRDSTMHSPDDLVRSVCSGIAMEPYTVIVLESTANGIGSFFHRTWLRAKNGDSAFEPVFVAWSDIEMYSVQLTDSAARDFIAEMDDTDRALWARGLTLQQIAWHHRKRREMSSAKAMMAEYPTDDVEAFVSSGAAVFMPEGVERLRRGCSEAPMRGDVDSIGVFHPHRDALLEVWRLPVDLPCGTRFIATVDIGGRTDTADWSVIAVIAIPPQGKPEVVAQWRGHIDHDLLAQTAVNIGRMYNNALLVVESNTMEHEGNCEGSALSVLEAAHETYQNLYRRQVRDSATTRTESRIGFHTNTHTKALVITTLIAAVRDDAYIERDSRAADEMMAYERRPNGSYGARRGYHDDVLMTRAIGLYVASTLSVDGLGAMTTFMGTRTY